MTSGIEIERKFLVERVPSELDTYPSDQIDQGYLAVTDDGLEVRIRSYGPHATLTIKSGAGTVRIEEEIAIDARRFGSLWPLTEGKRIRKRRYRIPAGPGNVLELDVYEDALAGLVTAEVEFDSPEAAAAFAAPDWLGRELTDDPRYKNRRLALEGLP